MVEKRIKALIPSSVTTVIGDLPGATSCVAAIRLFDGNANDEYFGKSTVYNPIVKIVVRHSSYERARQWIDQIRKALDKHHDDYFDSIYLVGYPMYLGQGNTKLHEFQIVFRIKVKE